MLLSTGTLPDSWLLQAIQSGCIADAHEACVQPASVDLRLSGEVYRVRAVGLPHTGERVKDLARRLEATPHTGIFERGVVYLARLCERLQLLQDMSGLANPKSTSGRLDVHVRVVVDGAPRFDTIPRGYAGEVWVFIVPQTFSVRCVEGTALTQLRLTNGNARVSDTELRLRERFEPILYTSHGEPLTREGTILTDHDGSCILTIDTEACTIGWRGEPCGPVIDLSLKHVYDPARFFTPVCMVGEHLLLQANCFYILSTKEFVRVPPDLSCDMHPMDDRSGEFRAHYAGFIDPGWGWGTKGEGKGRPLTLEVRPHENILVGPGQPIAKIGFTRMAALPRTAYDAGAPNYARQKGALLAKQFTPVAA